MLRIAVLDDYAQVALKLADWSSLRQRAEVVVFDRPLGEEQAREVLRGFTAVCLMRERMAFPGRLIRALPDLRCIAITGPRNRTLDLDAARACGIAVCTASGSPAASGGTVELAWGLILAAARQLPQQIQSLRAGTWQLEPGQILRGKTLALLGLGRLGAQMVPVARAFGMEVIAWSPNLTVERAQAAGAEHVRREALFERADFLSLHLVLSERTAGLVGEPDLERMKPGAWLVNTSRAGLVDPDALFRCLERRRIAGAALDVFEVEPLPAGDRLLTLPNVLLTPHLGYYTVEQMGAFYRNTVTNLQSFLDGKPINLVG
jgi:D-3-phosphoglycerate dehydrogenase